MSVDLGITDHGPMRRQESRDWQTGVQGDVDRRKRLDPDVPDEFARIGGDGRGLSIILAKQNFDLPAPTREHCHGQVRG